MALVAMVQWWGAWKGQRRGVVILLVSPNHPQTRHGILQWFLGLSVASCLLFLLRPLFRSFVRALFVHFSCRPICCITAAPGNGVKFSLTTMNSTEYFYQSLGLRMVTRQIPSGLSSVLFHSCKTRFVWWISSLLTYLIGRTLTVTLQSIWNLMSCSLIGICA